MTGTAAAGWLQTLFSAIDRKDAGAFAAHLAGSVELQFGNLPVVAGVEAARIFVAGFFESIKGLRHELHESWQCADGTIVCRGMVTYERHDGTILTVPFANIMRLEGGLATAYRIYMDASHLFRP